MRTWMVGWLGALALVAPGAHAADGVLEINQHCATVTGCFPGDSAGLPVTTAAGKSYVLTSSLTVAAAEQDGVQLADGATLDLNGFSITGPAVCTGTPPSCVGLGPGVGVLALGGGAVRNGRIAGMGGDGIFAFGLVTVEKILAEANGDDGIHVPSASLVSECRAVRNKDDGIQLYGAQPATVRRSSVFANGNRGVAGDALIVDTAIYDHTNAGFASGAETGIGYGALWGNAGGAGQPQGTGPITQVGPNVCDGGACP